MVKDTKDKRLTNEDIQGLMRKYKNEGDSEAYYKILNSFVPLVKSIAKKELLRYRLYNGY